MKEKFQSFGKAMLVPITLIAISGLFLGIGSVFTTELTLVSLGVNWDCMPLRRSLRSSRYLRVSAR